MGRGVRHFISKPEQLQRPWGQCESEYGHPELVARKICCATSAFQGRRINSPICLLICKVNSFSKVGMAACWQVPTGFRFLTCLFLVSGRMMGCSSVWPSGHPGRFFKVTAVVCSGQPKRPLYRIFEKHRGQGQCGGTCLWSQNLRAKAGE